MSRLTSCGASGTGKLRPEDTSAWQRSLRTSDAAAQRAGGKAPSTKPLAESHQRVTSSFLWALQAEAKSLRQQLTDTTIAKDARIEQLRQQLTRSKAEADTNRKAAEAAAAREAEACAKVQSLQAELDALRQECAAQQAASEALHKTHAAASQEHEELRASEAAALAALREVEAQFSASEDMVAVLSRTVLDFESEVASLRAELAAERLTTQQQATDLAAMETALGLECFANFLRAAAMAAELTSMREQLQACQQVAPASAPSTGTKHTKEPSRVAGFSVTEAQSAQAELTAEAGFAPNTPQRPLWAQQQSEEQPHGVAVPRHFLEEANRRASAGERGCTLALQAPDRPGSAGGALQSGLPFGHAEECYRAPLRSTTSSVTILLAMESPSMTPAAMSASGEASDSESSWAASAPSLLEC